MDNDDLEVLVASGIDPATAIVAAQCDAPQDRQPPTPAKQLGTLVGLILGIAASVAASWLLSR